MGHRSGKKNPYSSSSTKGHSSGGSPFYDPNFHYDPQHHYIQEQQQRHDNYRHFGAPQPIYGVDVQDDGDGGDGVEQPLDEEIVQDEARKRASASGTAALIMAPIAHAVVCDRSLYEEVHQQAKNNVSLDEVSQLRHKKCLRPEHRSLRRKLICSVGFAVALTIVVLALLIALAVVVFRHRQDMKRANETIEEIKRENSLETICLTPECVTASATILQSIDDSVDPCEDFYGFVCNGWIDRHPIPKGQSSWSVTDQRSEDNLETLRTLLERPLEIGASKAELKAKLLYRSCLDSDNHLEDLGSKPMHDIITAVGGWNLTGSATPWGANFAPDDFDLKRKLLAIQEFNTNALFHWYVREGMDNTSHYELFMHQGGLTLPSKEYYTKDRKARMALFRYISDVVKLLGGDPVEHATEIQAIIDFESALADRSTKETGIAGIFIPLDQVDKWNKLSVDWGSWREFFNEIIFLFLSGRDEDVPYLTGESKVWIQHEYFLGLERLLSTVENSNDLLDAGSVKSQKMSFFNTLNNYLTWRAIQPFVPFLTKDFEKAEKLFVKSLQGTQGREERWRTCVLNANAAMGFAIAPAFVREAFSETSRARAHQMVGEIKTAFKDRLSSLDWIDADTLQKIIRKIELTSELFGYPDFILNAVELDKSYAEFDVYEREFFSNQVRFHRFALLKNLRLLGRSVDRSSWPLNFPPSTVNAFYMYSRNQILFPAGVLQPPLFSERQPMSLNFGHIGTFMGHELLHGFDDTGRLYGPTGQMSPWWPNATSDTFKNKTKCFVKQYGENEIFPGVKLNGKRTLSENIADNGGLLAAFQGYKAWKRKNSDVRSEEEVPALLPGLNFTNEQLVFLGFARAHCSSTREKAMHLYLLTDRHSPSHVRVNTAVSNLKEFAEAYNCKPQSALVLQDEKRCMLW